jgi:opacity protein-like surface antigen
MCGIGRRFTHSTSLRADSEPAGQSDHSPLPGARWQLCNSSKRLYRRRRLKILRTLRQSIVGTAIFAFVITVVFATAQGGTETFRSVSAASEFEPPRFEFAAESAYLFGFINSPHSYEIGAEFLTARVRWGIVQNEESWLHGYNQVYVSAMAEPVFRGIENHYFGLNFGVRYNFVRPNSRLLPYFSGGLGLGWIDSQANIPGAQGQDFTFNILTAAGVSYRINDQWKLDAGLLYEHLSNGGQTDPNPSLNLLGPQIAVRCSF